MKLQEMFKPAGALVIIAAAAAVLLGYVYNITLAPIAAQRLKVETGALGVIFNTALDSSKAMPVPDKSPIERAYQVYSGKTMVGYAIFTSPIGYAGPVNMVVGIGADGVIRGVKVLDNAETPGLGANVESPAFTDQYIGKSSALKVTKAVPGDNEIQAVSSATITSNAVTKGVNDALLYFHAAVG